MKSFEKKKGFDICFVCRDVINGRFVKKYIDNTTAL